MQYNIYINKMDTISFTIFAKTIFVDYEIFEL